MPIINAANRIEERKMRREEGVRTDYARLEIDLDNASFVGTDIEIAVSGSYLAKISYDGDYTAYFRLDKRHAGKIYAHEFKSVRRRYDRLWLTNPVAQSGNKLVLQIGQIDYAEIIPDTNREPTDIKTAVEAATGSGVGNNFGTPGVGKRFEILGFSIVETEEAALAITTPAKLKFETSGIQLWTGILAPEGAVKNYRSGEMGIKILGGINEAIILTNAVAGAGSSQVKGIIFYRVVEA